jgi:CRISPR-associated protein Csd1
MLGVCPNNTRLAVRYWYHNTIGNFIEQVAQHYRDIDIGTNFDEPITSPYRILNETVSQKSRDKQPAPGLDKQLIRAIIEGTQYPLALYGAIINRVNVDSSINKHRAGFIKAYLNRMMRSNKNNHKELITMYLNENNNETPYLLGRLFAVLEKLQSDATGSGKNGKGELNSTIKDKYFSSASKTPLQVFPTLINLSTYHLKKLYAETKWGFKTDALINDIMGKLPDERYPKSLSMADQGLFQIGYFHQRTALFKKRDVVETVGEGQL